MKQNKALVAGLTGPAGSGKSYICKAFTEVTNTLIIDTDSIAREQMKKDGCSYLAVVREFGSGILQANGEIDRPKLASIVFNDAKKLKILNRLTHANVIWESKKIIRSNRSKYSLILLESAILTQSGCDKFCDETWYVYTPRAERIERLKSSRNYTDERIKSLMKSQNTDKYFRSHADAIIENRSNTDRDLLLQSLIKLLKKKRIPCF